MTKNNQHIFQESGINFHFSNNWYIHQYDRHRFYSGLSGAGLKGVDFIGIFNKKTLVLIEVKNYQDRYLSDNINPTEEFLKNPNAFLKGYVEKFRDTLLGIKTVQKYYCRKWWYRNLLLPLTKVRAIKFWLKYDWAFWTMAFQLAFEKEEKIQLILWLTLDKSVTQNNQFDQNAFQKELERLLKKELSRNNWEVHIASKTQNPFPNHLKTEPITN